MPAPPKPLPEKFIAISIIEDNPYLRSAWRATLERVADFVILGDYDACEAALQAEDIGDSRVILMDIGLPGMSGIEGVALFKQRFPRVNIIMVTVHQDDRHVFDAICAGAVGYLLKSVSPEEMIDAVRQAVDGGSPMTPQIARKVISAFQQSPSSTADQPDLTDKERQVLAYLAEGKSYKMIADAMNLSVHSIRYYLRSIYEKLQVGSRAEAVAKGLKQRLINPLRK